MVNAMPQPLYPRESQRRVHRYLFFCHTTAFIWEGKSSGAEKGRENINYILKRAERSFTKGQQ
jgi:hypothetical protein